MKQTKGWIIMKTIKDVLECAMYTTRNYKSDIFLTILGIQIQ